MSNGTDYVALESLLKDAATSLRAALVNLELVDGLLPDGITTAVAQDRVTTARKMVNRLRNRLDEMKSEAQR